MAKSSKALKSGMDPLLVQMFSTGLRKGDRKKAEIIQAAIHLIARDGLEGFSFDKLGQELKIAKSHVVYHFKSKDEILIRCIEYVTGTGQQIVVERLLKAPKGVERVHAWVYGNFEWIKKLPDHATVFLLLFVKAMREKLFNDLHHKVREASRQRVAAILTESGLEFEDGEDLERYAQIILDLLTGSALEVLSLRDQPFARATDEKAAFVAGACSLLLGPVYAFKSRKR